MQKISYISPCLNNVSVNMQAPCQSLWLRPNIISPDNSFGNWASCLLNIFQKQQLFPNCLGWPIFRALQFTGGVEREKRARKNAKARYLYNGNKNPGEISEALNRTGWGTHSRNTQKAFAQPRYYCYSHIWCSHTTLFHSHLGKSLDFFIR